MSRRLKTENYDKSRVNNFSYECAWILPDGTFYGVEFANHDVICNFHFGISVEKAEKLGWARLTAEAPFFQCLKIYTKAQINTISKYYEHEEAYYALSLFYKVILDES